MKPQVTSSLWVHCQVSINYLHYLCRNEELTSLCSTGVVLDPLCSHSVLREGDHRGDPAWRGPQRSRVVWGCGAAGLPAGSCDHVSSGQCVQLLLIRRPMQHKMPLNEWRSQTAEPGGRYRKDVTGFTTWLCRYLKEEVYPLLFYILIYLLHFCLLR